MKRLSLKEWQVIINNLQAENLEVEIVWLDSGDEFVLCHDCELFEDGFQTEEQANSRLEKILSSLENLKTKERNIQQLEKWFKNRKSSMYEGVRIMEDNQSHATCEDTISICFENSTNDYDTWAWGFMDDLQEQIENMGYGWEWYNSIELHIYPLF